LSEQIKEALFRVVDNTVIKKFSYIPGFSLGGKSGTSQIAFKGKYQRGIGWTNGSFVGIVTRDNLKYVIVVQVRRPRSNQW
jgi:cell division protein FtsI/penicillin-binding protein 2